MTCLRQAGRRDTKELLRLVYLSRKMGKFGSLCVFARLKIVDWLHKAGGKLDHNSK